MAGVRSCVYSVLSIIVRIGTLLKVYLKNLSDDFLKKSKRILSHCNDLIIRGSVNPSDIFMHIIKLKFGLWMNKEIIQPKNGVIFVAACDKPSFGLNPSNLMIGLPSAEE